MMVGGEGFVVAAYVISYSVLLGYALSIWRRQRRVQHDNLRGAP